MVALAFVKALEKINILVIDRTPPNETINYQVPKKMSWSSWPDSPAKHSKEMPAIEFQNVISLYA